MLLASCFYRDSSRYPNAGSPVAVADVYWKCMTVMAYTARHHGNFLGRIVIFSNEKPEGIVAEVLGGLAVEVIEIEFNYRPPEGFYHSFVGAFYLLDAIEWCAKNLGTHDEVVFIDPDCVVTGSLEPLFDAVRAWGIVATAMNFLPNYVGNGLSRWQLREVQSACFSAPAVTVPEWLGGELFGFDHRALTALASVMRNAWDKNIQLYNNGLNKFNTEEHFLSAAFNALNLKYYNAYNVFVKRIWTASVHRNYSEADVCLPVWHMPSEKRYGFQNYFHIIASQNKYFEGKNELFEMQKMFGLRGSWAREAVYITRMIVKYVGFYFSRRINSYG